MLVSPGNCVLSAIAAAGSRDIREPLTGGGQSIVATNHTHICLGPAQLITDKVKLFIIYQVSDWVRLVPGAPISPQKLSVAIRVDNQWLNCGQVEINDDSLHEIYGSFRIEKPAGKGMVYVQGPATGISFMVVKFRIFTFDRHTRFRQLKHQIDKEHEHTVGQSPSGSIINSEDFRSIRRFGATANDRLPGVVLLARERLVERLRGVHISQNRQISRSIHRQDDLQYNSLIEETNNSNDNNNLALLPPGLCTDELKGLSTKVFDENKENSSGSKECSICLEGFEDGDEVIELGCMHRFHSCCLFPWIDVCGACPNCRKDIAVGV